MRRKPPRYLTGWPVVIAISLSAPAIAVAIITGSPVLGAVILLCCIGVGLAAAYAFESGKHRGRHNGRST